jgi:S-adenosylmethionine decarboxylase
MDQKLAAKLGMDSATQPSEFHAAPQGADTLEARDTGHEDNVIRLPSAGVTTSDERLDHFVKRDGLTFAGTHLIIDLWGAKRLDELEHIEEALKECVTAAGPAGARVFRNLRWRAGYSDFSRCVMLGNNPASSITL